MPRPFDLLPALLDGLVVTIEVTVLAALLGLLMSFLAGLAQRSRRRPVRALARVYVEIFRGTSALVQLFWVYFALPLLGVEFTALAAAVVVLGLNAGAYGAEIVRGAIAAVPPGQYEAALVLGLSERQTLRRIVVPQALLATLPPFGNLLIELLKNTALVSMITLTDLTFEGQLLRASSLRTVEIFGLVLVLYFLVAQAFTAALRTLERRLAARRGIHGRSLL
ncbi:ectoine/hydroxyectoine ABC transporter permease subunit EhuC [Haliangium sp.]|uniref:ectoine/hydroxyectoine ABC transporter permease subunit EhuC n=1 Tax=Haliangium sp. TaxID=2663208 RepID=UPI003D14A6CA